MTVGRHNTGVTTCQAVSMNVMSPGLALRNQQSVIIGYDFIDKHNLRFNNALTTVEEMCCLSPVLLQTNINRSLPSKMGTLCCLKAFIIVRFELLMTIVRPESFQTIFPQH